MFDWLIDLTVWLGLVGAPDPELVHPLPPPPHSELDEYSGIIIGNGRALDGAAITREQSGVALAGVRVHHGRLVR